MRVLTSPLNVFRILAHYLLKKMHVHYISFSESVCRIVIFQSPLSLLLNLLATYSDFEILLRLCVSFLKS